MKISIIIPVYNEQDWLEKTVEKVQAIDLGRVEKEVLISNADPPDDTFPIIQKMLGKYPDLICYHSPANFGKGTALRPDIASSSGGTISIQDTDMELNPEETPDLLTALLDQRAQVLYGSPFLNLQEKMNRTSRLVNRFLTILTRMLCGAHLTDTETAYKTFFREALDGSRLRCVQFHFELEITASLLKKGNPITEILICDTPRSTQAGMKNLLDGWFRSRLHLNMLRIFKSKVMQCSFP